MPNFTNLRLPRGPEAVARLATTCALPGFSVLYSSARQARDVLPPSFEACFVVVARYALTLYTPQTNPDLVIVVLRGLSCFEA